LFNWCCRYAVLEYQEANLSGQQRKELNEIRVFTIWAAALRERRAGILTLEKKVDTLKEIIAENNNDDNVIWKENIMKGKKRRTILVALHKYKRKIVKGKMAEEEKSLLFQIPSFRKKVELGLTERFNFDDNIAFAKEVIANNNNDSDVIWRPSIMKESVYQAFRAHKKKIVYEEKFTARNRLTEKQNIHLVRISVLRRKS